MTNFSMFSAYRPQNILFALILIAVEAFGCFFWRVVFWIIQDAHIPETFGYCWEGYHYISCTKITPQKNPMDFWWRFLFIVYPGSKWDWTLIVPIEATNPSGKNRMLSRTANQQATVNTYPPEKLTWHWNIIIFNRTYIFHPRPCFSQLCWFTGVHFFLNFQHVSRIIPLVLPGGVDTLEHLR